MSEADGGSSTLKTLCQQVSALMQAVQRLQEGYFQLEGRLQHLTVTTPPAATGPSISATSAPSPMLPASSMPAVPEPWVPTPERFRGDRKKFRAFKSACLLYLALQPRTFNDESIKVGFVISLLSDDPQAWAHNLLDQKSSLLDSIDSFFEAMGQLYDDPQRSATAEAALQTLAQGKRPVEDYTVEFKRWAAETGWNEAALRHQFRQGLSETIKDELARVDTPTTLEGLIQLATKLDRRLRERRAERNRGPVPTWMMPQGPSASVPAPATPSSNHAGIEPMQLGVVRASLTPEEKQRRRQGNLCLYCGEPGHFLRNCPTRPSKSCPYPEINFRMAGTSQSHLLLPISLQVVGEEVRLLAIIDSGACSCFMDSNLAQKLQIPLQTKQQSLQVRLADGTLPCSGLVTQETCPLLMLTDSGHRELICFDLICSPLCPIILGLPWLQAHDPVIQWSNKTLSLASNYCLQHCFSPVSNKDISCYTLQTSAKPHPEVPAAYHQFLDVFDKKGADQLPPHDRTTAPSNCFQGLRSLSGAFSLCPKTSWRP